MIEHLSSLRIETDRLRIRRIEDRDVNVIYPIHSDPLVNQYLPYQTWETWQDAKHWYAKVLDRRRKQEAEQFVIELKDQGIVVGTCIAFAYCATSHRLEIGYVLGRTSWKQGYMLEAMSAFVPTLHQRFALDSIVASVVVDNLASLALLNKLGFTQVDTIVDNDGVHLSRLQKQFGTTA